MKVLGSFSLFENKKTSQTGIRQVLLDHGFCCEVWKKCGHRVTPVLFGAK